MGYVETVCASHQVPTSFTMGIQRMSKTPKNLMWARNFIIKVSILQRCQICYSTRATRTTCVVVNFNLALIGRSQFQFSLRKWVRFTFQFWKSIRFKPNRSLKLKNQIDPTVSIKTTQKCFNRFDVVLTWVWNVFRNQSGFRTGSTRICRTMNYEFS